MESMHDEELLYYSLKRIASTIERIINNSKAIDDSQYYAMLLPPNSYAFTQKYHSPVIFISFFRDYYIQKILQFLTNV